MPTLNQRVHKLTKIASNTQTVTSVTHFTDRLFSFRVTRPQSLRFRSGEFVMIGLLDENEKPILRAYSKPVGTLVLDALLPAKRIYFIATGTGFAPFASLIRDPDLYERYDQIIVCHTCREIAELNYSSKLVESLNDDPLIGEMVGDKLKFYPTTTRESSENMGRITDLIIDGTIENDLNLPPLNPKTDRLMVCGSMGLNNDIKKICDAAGMNEGSNSSPSHYVVEKAFVG
jgi:ferredoxin--NADP+ reductase